VTVTTLSEAETLPDAYPVAELYRPNEVLGDGSRGGASPVTANAEFAQVTWQRIEAWISRRWPERQVVYITEGAGEWCARLQPFAISAVERWTDDAWQAVSANPSPMGGIVLASDAHHRITGIAGDDTDPPGAVIEAFRRLHEYNVGLTVNWWTDAARTEDLAHNYAARAIQLSGAADLLRPWRRLS